MVGQILRAGWVLVVLLLLTTGLLAHAQSSTAPPAVPLPPLPPQFPNPPQRVVRPLSTNPIPRANQIPPAFRSIPAPKGIPTNQIIRPMPLIPAAPIQLVPTNVLTWEAEVKEYAAKTGELSAPLSFSVTNVSFSEVLINNVRTSCGCTVAKLPNQPWKLMPGERGDIHFTVDLRGKSGLLVKTASIETSRGFKSLTLKVNVPAAAAGMGDRVRNLQIAAADRQAVFRSDCAKCHAEPTAGKIGQDLYVAACAICHDAEHRASMVPDLHALKHPTDGEYWKKWIASGKPGSLMPAFAKAEGGPLTEEQISSLVEYLSGKFQQQFLPLSGPHSPPVPSSAAASSLLASPPAVK